ncbi:MAG: cytochrome c assembly protein [Chitinophagaceae bacterium]|nr:MAG: cytochrome c assembly protein [Chitinophagaceae bacterium]
MNFIGEHLLPGQLGHFFVILAFVAALLSTIAYFISSGKIQKPDHHYWMRLARIAFFTQVLSIFVVFGIVFYICSNHLYEYMYAYKHASLELEKKYLLACIWEGQEGSFLLWSICHAIFGSLVIFRRNSDLLKSWEAPVMTVISLAQFFLLLMILGVYVGDTRIGNSLFSLTRNEINAPIFNQPNYLTFVKDGMGLNILLRNYWMVIHPPVLFMGFASTIIPFAFAYAGIKTQRFGDWVKPALPWALASAAILGVGIMMGAKWAYESLSFGGYWAWDPVENASLVPWLILIAGLHTMAIYKATGHSLRASYLFAILSFCFVLYSTFLTRTGVLGDTSVHSFTEAGKAINIMIGLFVLSFALPSLVLFFINYKKIPTIHKEENTSSREFWMFIGSLVFFLTAIFIIAKTSVPVINSTFGTKIAPPEDVEFSYNKVGVLIAFIIGLLTAFTQYLKYRQTNRQYFLPKIALPTLIAAVITALLAIFYPITYYKQGTGFLVAIYVAIFATIYAVLANAAYIWIVLKGRAMHGGASIAHAGFALMIFGMLVSSGNKKVISSSMVNGIVMPAAEDPMTKQKDNPRENLTLIRQVPTAMGEYEVTYTRDSAGHEKGRRFYELLFQKKSADKKVTEQFILKPDVYMMKDNNFSSNPDTRSYFTKDVFTYLSYALNNEAIEDTAQFRTVEMHEGDTSFYAGGYIILNSVEKNPNNARYKYKPTDVALMANLTVVGKDSIRRQAMPLIEVDSLGVINYDDTLYAENLYLRFVGVGEKHHIKVGIKESDQPIDFVTVKAYIFPLVNLVWLGLIVMAIGLVMSMLQRGKFRPGAAGIVLLLVSAALIYMFLFANN